METLVTAGVSDNVAQELQMPIGPQALEDVGETIPATFKDPGTLDQIVLYQHSLTHFPSQLWCHVCVESRGREFRSREQSKFDSVVPQLQFDYGFMGTEAFCRLRRSSWEQTLLLEPYMRHFTWFFGTTQWVRDREYERFCLQGEKEEFFCCCWTKLPK